MNTFCIINSNYALSLVKFYEPIEDNNDSESHNDQGPKDGRINWEIEPPKKTKCTIFCFKQATRKRGGSGRELRNNTGENYH